MQDQDLREPWKDDAPPRVGISSCLLGQKVRWDGGHKRDRFLTETLSPYVEWVPICPEVELGMGTPREPVRLERRGEGVRMLATRSGRDWTRPMNTWSARRARELTRLDLCGYVLKKDSPSCGMQRIEVHSENGAPRREGRGLFAQCLRARHPALPVEEEDRLQDPQLRENFIERIFAYRRLRSLLARRFNLARLVAFHTAHELQLRAHSPQASRSLGGLVATAAGAKSSTLLARYEREFMAALAQRATRRRQVNVLQHCAGYFREDLDGETRAELTGLIQDYRAGLVPLLVPVTLIRHCVQRLGVAYLAGQVYLEPHPKELMLRNHV